MHHLIRPLLCLTLTAGTLVMAATPEFTADSHTLFLLRVNPATRAFVDVTGKVTPIVSSGEVVNDAAWGGPCLRLTGGEKSGITIRDDGKLSFQHGMVLDAWVRFDEPPQPKSTPIALKVGSFAWSLVQGRLTTEWLAFPTEEIFTTEPKQFKYYPVGVDRINGLRTVPPEKWTRLTMAYDAALGAVTTQIDGVTDRSRFRYRGPQPLLYDAHNALTLLQGTGKVSVGTIHLRKGRPRLTPPSLEVYANTLPAQDKIMFTFDHIDPDLPLPLDVTLIREYATGGPEMLHTTTFDSHARRDLLLDALPSWKNTLFTYHITVSSAGRGILTKTLRAANLKPAGPVRLHPDGTLSRDGKKFFPLLAYHAMPEDFPTLAALGFNTLANDFSIGQRNQEGRQGYTRLLQQTLDAAQQHHLGVLVSANSTLGKLHTIPIAKDHPALLAWYGADEPWGDITRLHESYNTLKLLAPDPPIFIVQNNYSRLQDTAPACDILSVDPYPIPNVSLRAVADATLAARRAVANHKPIWTILPQYATKVPTREELRCMAWLAIASGANGLGIYAWDDRVRDPQTGTLSGWHTPAHPEQIENLRVVLKELITHEPILIAPTAAQQPTLQPPNPALHLLIKEAQGKRWLILANDSRREESALLEISAVNSAKPLTADTPALQTKSGRTAVTLPPLGIHIYELTTQ